MPRFRGRAGFSLLELLAVTLLVSILAALALPRLSVTVQRLRAKAALGALVSDLHHARMLAVRAGRPTGVRFERGTPPGCLAAYALEWGDTRELLVRRPIGPGTPCLAQRGAPAERLVFNSRGLLSGGARTVYATVGAASDSVVVAISGRIRWVR